MHRLTGLQTMPASVSSPRRRTSSEYIYIYDRGQRSDTFCSNAPKYRLVVRFTNKQIIVQIVYARLQGDFVLAAATSKELPRYGINHGLTNWTAGACICFRSSSQS